MTQKSWPWDTNPPTGGPGDGATGLNEAASRVFLAFLNAQDLTKEGVFKGLGGDLAGELEVSGVSSPLEVQPGAAICYGLYYSDAVETLGVATPAVGTTGGRVVLRTNWAGQPANEATTRLAVKLSADGDPSIPALTQTPGSVWEISGPTFTITTGGVITLSGGWTFRRSTAMVGTDEIENLSVTFNKLPNFGGTRVLGRADNSTGPPGTITASTNDRILARVSDALNWVQLTIGMIPDLLITEAKLAAAVAAKLVTNGNSHDHNGGDGAQIPSGGLADEAVIAGKLANGAVDATERMADDIVDDTKVGDRVPKLVRRQGGNATDWSVPGTNNYTPGAVKEYVGSYPCGFGAASYGGSIPITFPAAFSGKPILTFGITDASGPAANNPFRVDGEDVTTAGFTLIWRRAINTSGPNSFIAHWHAIGPE